MQPNPILTYIQVEIIYNAQEQLWIGKDIHWDDVWLGLSARGKLIYDCADRDGILRESRLANSDIQRL